jgi:prepilin-type N-terminal cleavage/methylation domain-containing protein
VTNPSNNDRGFTIVEVMVAMLILVVGLFAMLAMLDRANAVTTSGKAREQGVALQRELVEAARGLPYSQLTQTSIVGLVRGTTGFSSSAINTGQGWQIERRGITYTMAIGVCSVDDSSDGTGVHDGASFCANGAGKTSAQSCSAALGRTGDIAGSGSASGATVGDCGIDLDRDGAVDNLTEGEISGCGSSCGGSGSDTNPNDYKRIVTLVRWKAGEGSRFALQSTTLPYPGFSGAPRITSLTPQGGLVVTNSTTTTVTFQAATNRQAQSVGWTVGGTPQSPPATDLGGGTSWEFTWKLFGPPAAAGPSEPASGVTPPAPSAGEVLDGPYEVAARAYDTYGSAGAPYAVTVTINRRQPYAPRVFQAVRVGNTVETDWAANNERDIVGYQVYRKGPSGTIELVRTLQSTTDWRDTSLPASGDYEYFARAVDRDSTDSLRLGDASAWITQIPMDNEPPAAPSNVQAVRQSPGGPVSVTWDASSGDPDGAPGAPNAGVAFYRVFRDGTAIADRIGKTATGADLSFVDPTADALTHSYYVRAVDSDAAESTTAGGASA